VKLRAATHETSSERTLPIELRHPLTLREQAIGTRSRHGVKQVHRPLFNQGINVWELFVPWGPFTLARSSEALVALDWTDFGADGQPTLVT
jgi:hypothetical protein